MLTEQLPASRQAQSGKRRWTFSFDSRQTSNSGRTWSTSLTEVWMSGFGAGAQTRPGHSALLPPKCMSSMFVSQVLRTFLGASSTDCCRYASDVFRQSNDFLRSAARQESAVKSLATALNWRRRYKDVLTGLRTPCWQALPACSLPRIDASKFLNDRVTCAW